MMDVEPRFYHHNYESLELLPHISGITLISVETGLTMSPLSHLGEKVSLSELQYDMLANERCLYRHCMASYSSALLRCCQCLSLLCFHLSAHGRKPEGNSFRMEETSKTECSLSKLKISLRQSPPPSHCHFYFLSPALLLCLALCVFSCLKFSSRKTFSLTKVRMGTDDHNDGAF